MATPLTAALFRPHVGTVFTVCDEGAPEVAVTLSDVTEGRAQPGAPRTDPFTLAFTGPPNRQLEQRMYTLEHPEMGRLEIFLVPVGPGTYEAVFN